MNFDELNEERRKSVAQTLRLLDTSEVEALREKIFPYYDDPWRERFMTFVAENPGASFYHASLPDNVQILYCRSANRGIWFTPGHATGIISEKNLKVLEEITGGVV